MSLEYILGKTNSNLYDQLSCPDGSNAIVRNLSIYGFGDGIHFERKTSRNASFGSYWGIHSLGCFKELRSYTRLMDMPENAVEKLAARIYELLYMDIKKKKYSIAPVVNRNNKRFRQILEELTSLHSAEKMLAKSGKILFPQISERELEVQDAW